MKYLAAFHLLIFSIITFMFGTDSYVRAIEGVGFWSITFSFGFISCAFYMLSGLLIVLSKDVLTGDF